MIQLSIAGILLILLSKNCRNDRINLYVRFSSVRQYGYRSKRFGMENGMDNFMDTLAQKYNAQEMIKANSQAEAAEMKRLQEQVEAYEAVLQEMRKLNYKNTELTEKMYSLVDQSIEKVRTLQLEASEGGANTALISQQMTEAVNSALSEALNNMDASVAQSLSQSVASALTQPTEQLKESSERMGSSLQDVKDAMTGISQSAQQIVSSAEEVRATSEAIRTAADDIMLAADDVRNSNQSLDETIRSQVETDKIFNDLLKNQLTQVMENSRHMITALEEMKVSLDTQVEMQTKTQESAESSDSAERETASREELAVLIESAYQEQFSVLMESAESIKTSLEALQYADEATKAYLSDIKENNAVMTASLQELMANSSSADLQELVTNVTALNAKAEQLQSFQNEIAAQQSRIAEAQELMRAAQVEMNSMQKEYLEAANPQNGAGQNEDLRTFMAEQSASNEEITNGIRSVKLATDDAKSTLKSSFDSAIYGLKQDNKEIVEFMQRMNTGLLAKFDDPEKENRQQEELEKQEEERKALEERFKANEDFIHKESVKV